MRNELAKHGDRATRRAESQPSPPATDAGMEIPSVSLLALQFLSWLAARARTRADVMDAWRSTCPRQSVWEDMVIDGLVTFEDVTSHVVLTSLGEAVLAAAARPQN